MFKCHTREFPSFNDNGMLFTAAYVFFFLNTQQGAINKEDNQRTEISLCDRFALTSEFKKLGSSPVIRKRMCHLTAVKQDTGRASLLVVGNGISGFFLTLLL